MDRRFLSLKELCQYTGCGMTKIREIVKSDNCDFAVRIGNKYFVDKILFDKHMEKCMKYHIPI